MTIIDYLQNAAEKNPDKTAFWDKEKSVTYKEVYISASRIATAIIHWLEGENEPIAVMTDGNVESICAFMGVAMSRNFYVPVDAALPPAQIKEILDQLNPLAIISIGNAPEEIRNTATIPVMEYEELMKVEEDPPLIARIRRYCLDTDPLYRIDSPDSMGVSEGILTSHRDVLDFIPVFCRKAAFNKEMVFENQVSFGADDSAKDIYATLYLGAGMRIIPV